MMTSSLRLVYETMTSDDKVGGWVKKGQNHDDVILECRLCKIVCPSPKVWDFDKKGFIGRP